MRLLNKLTYIFLLCACIVISVPTARAERSEADMLDAILAGMGEDDYTSLASLVSGSSKKSPSQNIANSDIAIIANNNYNSYITGNSSKAGVEGALDYILSAYGSEGQYSVYGDSRYWQQNNSGRTSRYAHLLPGTAVLPVIGKVTSNFGWRPRFGRMHKGTDISLHVGDTVVAAIDGKVTRVKNDPRGYGLYVCVTHANGLETRYAHLSKFIAYEGQQIFAGEPVGLGGSTGNSTGPHLHFEVRVNGEAIDATTMFDFNTPGGYTPYRTLADLDSRNPRFSTTTDPYTGYTTDPYNSFGASYGNGNNANPADPYNAGASSGGTSTRKSTYIVRSGDTIASIARKHNMSVLTLCRLNGLSTDDSLNAGRMLKLR